ncbi:MAG: hypothetical protein JSW52_00350 [Candidatus Coatesbacteria bacterium]|nr:MAG: hypothetical protein JSW52_00350 [Candidatus Coatesbacteria bacterium]
MRKYANYAIWMAGAVALILAATVTAGDYVGSETCSMCHTDKHDSWSETAHAESIKVLVDSGMAENEECLTCHTTALGTDAYEKAVACESCHGPGSAHVEAGGGAGSIERATDESLCLKCHTDEWSPDFNFDEYSRTGIHE